MFYKIFKSKSPQYLFKLISEKTSSYATRTAEKIPLFNMFSCGSSIESTSHFLLQCPIFHDKTHTLLSTLNSIDNNIPKY